MFTHFLRLHSVLWPPFQSVDWHSLQQYQTSLHREHCFTWLRGLSVLPARGASSVSVWFAMAWYDKMKACNEFISRSGLQLQLVVYRTPLVQQSWVRDRCRSLFFSQVPFFYVPSRCQQKKRMIIAHRVVPYYVRSMYPPGVNKRDSLSPQYRFVIFLESTS